MKHTVCVVIPGSAPPKRGIKKMMKAESAMTATIYVEPGRVAPKAGLYVEIDLLGEPTGGQVTAEKDEQLPRSPVGLKWRLIRSEIQRGEA
jgi:hypothetical protein